jgi:hypothetical protein
LPWPVAASTLWSSPPTRDKERWSAGSPPPRTSIRNDHLDDALIQPYSGHETRTSLEIYSRLSITDAQHAYDAVIDRFPI